MKYESNDKVVAKLLEALDSVREDVARVEFWASAVTGFSQPVPDYRPGDMNVWVPPEQAATLKRSGN